MLKRFSLVLVLAIALMMVFAGAAFANFGPHGGYVDDTDSCAGCHRAHTSFSGVGWTDRSGGAHESALLVGSANTITEFCNACHGDLAPGASTNVVSGIFDSGPSGASGDTVGAVGQTTGADGGAQTIAYATESTFNAPLNGGGFTRMPDPYIWETSATAVYKTSTSAHSMQAVGPLWGAGNGVDVTTNLTCTSCHDPHGTSNFRLLKGSPNGSAVVGGYTGTTGETPNPYVFSSETNYPLPNGADPVFGMANASGGWLKHEDGADQMAVYAPDYTTPKYIVTDITGTKSMSTWCSACHERYDEQADALGDGTDYVSYEGTFGGGSGVGEQVRHRHPVEMPLFAGKPNPDGSPSPTQSLNEAVQFDPFWIPLADNPTSADPYADYVTCLTCHRAHGSSADMTATTTRDGYANAGWGAAHLEFTNGRWVPVRDGIPGVDPDKTSAPGIPGDAAVSGTSALLRADNRGVCERCHNK